MRIARAAFVLLAMAALGPVEASARTWYVSADADPGAAGTRAGRPLESLARAEQSSRPGDRIVVLPAAKTLGGGIALKPRQQLIGGAATRDAAPRITNTDKMRLDGDAIRLADGVSVRNLEIVEPLRGGIYGSDVTRVTITGNDVSGHNTSCARGFHIPSFNVPTLVPHVGIPISEGLHNGWAGIMVDVARGSSKLGIRANRVHHAECGDGIDVRASGTASVRATIAGNDVRDLRQGESFESVLALGLQTRDRARLVARLDANRQAGLGNDEDLGAGPTGADSEGIFINPSGPSSMRVTVTRNSYTHVAGRGGFSANGLEFVAMGDGSRALVDVRDSTFSGTPGDILEQLALGTNARLRLRLDRVVATRSTGFAGSGYGDTVVIPGNNADCLIAASGGAGNTVDLIVRRSTLTGCANNGLTFGSAVANGSGPTSELTLDVADSTITHNHGANLRIGNIAGLGRLRAKVQRTSLSDSRGAGSSPANVTVEDLGTTRDAVIDLGGGPLRSDGGNCLGGGALAALLVGYDVHARGNWWGAPGGPGLGRTVAVGGALDAGAPLSAAPAGC